MFFSSVVGSANNEFAELLSELSSRPRNQTLEAALPHPAKSLEIEFL
jgi:hypothetical protein